MLFGMPPVVDKNRVMRLLLMSMYTAKSSTPSPCGAPYGIPGAIPVGKPPAAAACGAAKRSVCAGMGCCMGCGIAAARGSNASAKPLF